MNTKTFTGWIVDVKERTPRGLWSSFWCGIYYKFSPLTLPQDVGDLLGVRTMIFRTRDQARELATYIDRQPWPWNRNAIVRKVEVTIKVIGHG